MPKVTFVKDPYPGRDELAVRLGIRIRRSGKTIKELAEPVGLSRQNLSAKIDSPEDFRISEFIALCNAVGMNPAEGMKILTKEV